MSSLPLRCQVRRPPRPSHRTASGSVPAADQLGVGAASTTRRSRAPRSGRPGGSSRAGGRRRTSSGREQRVERLLVRASVGIPPSTSPRRGSGSRGSASSARANARAGAGRSRASRRAPRRRVVAVGQRPDELVGADASRPRGSPRRSRPAGRTRCCRGSCRRTGRAPGARSRAGGGASSVTSRRSCPSTGSPAGRVVEPGQQLHDRRLAGAGGAHQRDVAPPARAKETPCSTSVRRRSEKCTSSNATSPRLCGSSPRVGLRRSASASCPAREDLVERRCRRQERLVQLGERLHRVEEVRQVGDEREQRRPAPARRGRPGAPVPEHDRHGHRREELDEGEVQARR